MERNPSRNPSSDQGGEAMEGRKKASDGGKRLMVEEAFRETTVPPWTKQITIRSVVTSFVLSIVFNFIVCKLNLTTGVIPSLNVAAGLLGFAVVKGYTSILEKCGLLKQPFTRQENTVIQTCVVASSGIAFSSTFSNLSFSLAIYSGLLTCFFSLNSFIYIYHFIIFVLWIDSLS